MMYRRNAAQTPRPDHVVAGGGASFVSMAASKVLEYLTSIGMVQQAERENRRFNRIEKRVRKHTTYFAAGLNGARALARRKRQRLAREAKLLAHLERNAPTMMRYSKAVVSSYAASFAPVQS